MMMITIIRMYIKKQIIYFKKDKYLTFYFFIQNINYFIFYNRVDSALEAQNRRLPCKRPEKLYKTYLENRHKLLSGTSKWAELEKKDKADFDLDNDILKVFNDILKI